MITEQYSLKPGYKYDPLDLRKYKVTESHIKSASRNVANFYRDQNNLIDSFLTDMECNVEEKNEIDFVEYKIAMYTSAVANVMLFGVQLAAAILTGSLALFATTLDAFMDVASTVVLIVTGRDDIKYPTGKAKYKTAGIIVFATLMATLSLQIWVESAKALLNGTKEVNLDVIAIVIVSCAIGFKLCLYAYCRNYSRLPSIKILAQDHLNDVIFNSFGLVFSTLGARFASWIDPAGAILIAFFIMKSWGSTAFENIRLIVGVSAETAFLNRVVYLSMTHDPRILQVDTCRAYHSGYNVFVEVDVILPPDMRLNEAHDIGEDLQIKIESLPEVDRAFVHLDHTHFHLPEHRRPKSD